MIRLVALWNPKARRWVSGRRNWFEQLHPHFSDTTQRWVWMHCASLGEFEQGRPVLEAIRQQYPAHKLLLTFFSPSGYEVRKDYKGADLIAYLPMDSKPNAMKFIDMVKPQLVVWVKYEYWYHYLTTLRKRQVPVLLISGIFRKEQPFFKWYGRLHQYMLESFSRLFVQNEASRELLNGIGFKKVTVNGDTRFDRVAEIAAGFTAIPAIEAFCGNHPVIVAGSTWDTDEEELDHYANTHPEIRFIIAPHEIDAPHLHDIEKLFKHTIRFSEWSKTLQAPENTNTLIIDNIGMLSRLYRYAHITYIGGGFGKDGVHNVLEAAVYGKPVVFGPVYDKFIEAEELVDAGGGFSIETALELEHVFNEFLNDPQLHAKAASAAARYVAGKTGATKAVMDFIGEEKLL
ncbi:glycosyltransferase N-terminal domain-containing protein [Pseudoflavitalea sp. G-6-1-2]|uniref:3-deoxy-D-manno-octulosonic acid transferase n=1 Tax=Pseudoflavitalea sp. G-6-1-2 TaxID=2728841 RepID=UPI001F116AE9|nr:glycosyltransferase N-terminal domain-containing protein [Pseudoflavitalea sp. G-6-1-2]